VSLSISALTFSTVKALLPGRERPKYLLHLCPESAGKSCSFRSQFRPTDIFQLDERTIRRGLDYHFLKLGNVCRACQQLGGQVDTFAHLPLAADRFAQHPPEGFVPEPRQVRQQPQG